MIFTDTKIINPNNVKESLLDPQSLYKINAEIIYILNFQKIVFDKFASDGVLGTSLSIRNGKPQIIINKDGLIGNINKKIALFVADVPSHEVLSSISLIREHGGICDKCIVIMDTENMNEMFKNNKVELYSLVKKSDYGVF